MSRQIKSLSKIVNKSTWPEKTKDESILEWGGWNLIGFMIFNETMKSDKTFSSKLKKVESKITATLKEIRTLHLGMTGQPGIEILVQDLSLYYENLKKNWVEPNLQINALEKILANKWWDHSNSTKAALLTILKHELFSGIIDNEGKKGGGTKRQGPHDLAVLKCSKLIGCTFNTIISTIKDSKNRSKKFGTLSIYPNVRNEFYLKTFQKIFKVDDEISKTMASIFDKIYYIAEFNSEQKSELQAALLNVNKHLEKLTTE